MSDYDDVEENWKAKCCEKLLINPKLMLLCLQWKMLLAALIHNILNNKPTMSNRSHNEEEICEGKLLVHKKMCTIRAKS